MRFVWCMSVFELFLKCVTFSFLSIPIKHLRFEITFGNDITVDVYYCCTYTIKNKFSAVLVEFFSCSICSAFIFFIDTYGIQCKLELHGAKRIFNYGEIVYIFVYFYCKSVYAIWTFTDSLFVVSRCVFVHLWLGAVIEAYHLLDERFIVFI